MIVDRVIKDVMRTLREIVQALDNNVTVNDNFGRSGVPTGWTIISQGPLKIPRWGPADQLVTSTGSQAVGQDGVDGAPGAPGSPGSAGPPGADASALGHWSPLAFDGEIVFDAEGDLIEVWVPA